MDKFNKRYCNDAFLIKTDLVETLTVNSDESSDQVLRTLPWTGIIIAREKSNPIEILLFSSLINSFFLIEQF